MKLCVVILTRDESKHLGRALASVRAVASEVVVVDSGSEDDTRAIARAAGARVFENPWVNYATQFNHALGYVSEAADWVLRLDADEIVSPELAGELARLSTLPATVDGVFVPRRMTFLRRPIRWGGVFPVRVLRVFRRGRGRCENRWMDEHVLVEGDTVDFEGELLDDNVNDLTWWTAKHNAYASREVVDLLNLEYGFMRHETVADLRGGQQAGVKRWLKEHVYRRMPGGLRAFVYFLYRYVLRLGFLDGAEGFAFHLLQGLWYRALVDAKLLEVRRHMARTGCGAPEAIADVLGIDVLK